MTELERTSLIDIARRVVWFKSPQDALSDERHFLAHLLCYGSLEDIQYTRRTLGDGRVLDALVHAPSGVFSPRQWNFWHRHFQQIPVPPLPKRRLR